jgi:hypothetical protein
MDRRRVPPLWPYVASSHPVHGLISLALRVISVKGVVACGSLMTRRSKPEFGRQRLSDAGARAWQWWWLRPASRNDQISK